MTQAFHSKLHIRRTQLFAGLAGIDFQRPIRVGAALRAEIANVADVELARLPRQQSRGNLFGETLGIGRGAKCFLGQQSGCLMVAVSIARGAGESRDQHVGAIRANHAHHVGQHQIMAAPLLKSLIGSFRKSEISGAREALLHAVILIGGQQFQRAQHAQAVGKSAPQFVLPAFPAIQRHQQDVNSQPAGLVSEHAAIFVVGVGGGLHHARGGPQLAEHLCEAGSAAVLRQCRHAAKVGERPGGCLPGRRGGLAGSCVSIVCGRLLPDDSCRQRENRRAPADRPGEFADTERANRGIGKIHSTRMQSDERFAQLARELRASFTTKDTKLHEGWVHGCLKVREGTLADSCRAYSYCASLTAL